MTVQLVGLSWQARAACRSVDPEIFYVAQGESTKPARAVCAVCAPDVKAECLAYALRNNEIYGIWGGTSERERRRLWKGLPLPDRPEIPTHAGRTRTFVPAPPLHAALTELVGTRFRSRNHLSTYVSHRSSFGPSNVLRFLQEDRKRVSIEWATIVCDALELPELPAQLWPDAVAA